MIYYVRCLQRPVLKFVILGRSKPNKVYWLHQLVLAASVGEINLLTLQTLVCSQFNNVWIASQKQHAVKGWAKGALNLVHLNQTNAVWRLRRAKANEVGWNRTNLPKKDTKNSNTGSNKDAHFTAQWRIGTENLENQAPVARPWCRLHAHAATKNFNTYSLLASLTGTAKLG